MKTSKIFRCLLTLLVFWGVTVCAVAQETRRVLFGLGTADGKNLVFNTLSGSKPHGVSVRASNFNSGEFYSSVTQTEPGWYVKVGETGTISFENFNYEIKSVGIRRNIESASFSDTELNVSVSPLSGVKPDNVFDNKVDWGEPECTNISLKKNGTSISLDGIKQIDVTVPSSHFPTINRNTYVREVSIEYVLPEIRIRFANGNKGYDVTVGDNNAQIEGYISGHAGAFVVGSDNVYFKYTSSNSSIAEISSTGKITAKAEGDTQITATLIQKVGNTEYEIASYDYPLHVFAPFEGLSWNSYDTWYKNSTINNSSYKFGGEPHVNGIDWTISDKLKSQTTIWENESNTQSSGQYKQFASFEAPAPTTEYWRAAVQKLSCDILVPKYTKVESTMKFGANATLGSESKRDVTYGYELVDLGIKTDANTTFAAASAAATTRIGEITWNTASTAEDASSVSAYRTSDRGNGITYLRNGANEYRKHNILTGLNNGEGYVGDHYTAGAYWKYDNSKNAGPYNETRFFAAMVFLQNQVSYSATVSFGYQDIPTYEYYVYLDYYANYDDNKHLGREERSVKAKDATIHLNSGNVSFVPNRTGYKLLGWSTDKDAKTAEFPVNGDFYPYDSENGGGKGPVTLYAVWEANEYLVSLNHNGGQSSINSVKVTYGKPWPAAPAPTKTGYNFEGYYGASSGTPYYDSNMQTVNNWPFASGGSIIAHWIPKTTTITFDRNGAVDKLDWGGDNGTSSVTATYDANMPDMIPPSRAGYEFIGYFDAKTGGKQYYYTGVKWDKDVEEATLYAHWRAKTVKVIFNYTDPSKNILAPNKEVTGYTNGATNHSSLSGTGVTAPMYEDYLFDGWYEQDGKNKTYDAEGNAVEGKYWVKNSDGVLVWQSDNDVNLYPLWIKDATTVEIAEIRLNNYEGDGVTHNYVGVSVSGMTSISNFRGKGYITVDGVNYLTWHKNGNEDNLLSAPLSEAPVWNIDAVDGSPNKVLIYTDTPEGRKYLGNKIENGQVTEDAIGIEDNQPAFYFTIYNERGWICLDDSEGHLFNHILYMKTGNVWEYENTGDNPQYNPIRILAYGSSTSYGDLMSTKVISEIKKKLSTPVVVNGVNTYPYAYNGKVDADLCKGILYVDMGGAASVIEANANELVNFKKEVSDNCLFFMPSNYTNTGLGNNVVSFNGTNYNSLTNLVIKDKVPFFNPYKFHVGNGVKASYHRDYDYKWNSMCLPFPVKLSSDMKYYKLYGSDNLRLAFVSMSDDVIAANTPVACYGNGTFTLENTGIDVPADVDGEKVYVENVDAISCDDIKDYVENKKGTPASQTWNFKGVRFDTYVYGTKNTGTLPNRAEKSLVYYFANDEFRYVNPEGRVKFAPYRAFLQAPDGLFAKSYRILVFDEEGATDITDIVDAAEGDGKIYDLQGRRVKTPLKGHVYVVGGKKRLY